ncbi:aminoglycoside phosphotransferase family protein [Streptomyces sp. NPDC055400]
MSDQTWERLARLKGAALSGYHNQNYVLSLTGSMSRRLGLPVGTRVTLRTRKAEALPVVIRTWQHEAGILDAIGGVLPHVPQCLARRGDESIHSYVEGVPLSAICPNGKRVGSRLVSALAGLLADMTRVPRCALPALPESWPRRDGEGGAFLRALALAAEKQIREPNWPVFEGLFTDLGIFEDALTRFAERLPTLGERPFSLLHGDLHRDNVIISHGAAESPLICVDWELATYGDPLHDLATHLVRMDYPEGQWAEVIGEWRRAMGERRPEAVHGLGQDLRHFIDFEHAQSIYPDVMRPALWLQRNQGEAAYKQAAAVIGRAIGVARAPLQLAEVPGPGRIERALRAWVACQPV